MSRLIALALLGIAVPGQSLANPDLIATDRFAYRSDGELALDGGIVVGAPAALPTGLARGLGAGFSYGRSLAWGAQVAATTATESTMAWRVSHTELRLRVTGAAQHAVGRGVLALRLGLGGTMVHESRLRNQGARAGLTGDDLSTSTYAMLPAADLDAMISLHVAGPWLVVVSAGPSLALDGNNALTSWNARLGVAWQP